MKTLATFIKEESTESPARTDLENIADKLGDDLRKLFGDGYVVKTGFRKILGGLDLGVVVYGINPENNINLNSPCYTGVYMNLKKGDKFSWEVNGHTRREVKFRKITGNSIEDAVAKLYNWFKKSKPVYDQLMGY